MRTTSYELCARALLEKESETELGIKVRSEREREEGDEFFFDASFPSVPFLYYRKLASDASGPHEKLDNSLRGCASPARCTLFCVQ